MYARAGDSLYSITIRPTKSIPAIRWLSKCLINGWISKGLEDTWYSTVKPGQMIPITNLSIKTTIEV